MSVADRVKPGEWMKLEDGYWYYWPEGMSGCFSSENLRDIADRLDEKNYEWDREVEAALEYKDKRWNLDGHSPSK